jgi:hypothetical protein
MSCAVSSRRPDRRGVCWRRWRSGEGLLLLSINSSGYSRFVQFLHGPEVGQECGAVRGISVAAEVKMVSKAYSLEEVRPGGFSARISR